MKLDLTKITAKYLKQNPGQKFTAREIAEWVLEAYPKECREKQKRSTIAAIRDGGKNALTYQLMSQIAASLPVLRKNHKITTIEDRPRKYYFAGEEAEPAPPESEENDQLPQAALSSDNDAHTKEYELYPILGQFLWSEHNIYTKRIDERRSRNKRGPKGNRWLYPDIVGMEDLSADWEREVKDCVKEHAGDRAKMWSFEVKARVNRPNVREMFFQCVSNSSWANLGYLVASEIEGAETLKELRILSSLHGIGFIRLDTDNPSESEIVIPARERPQIDWDIANRLVGENKDFSQYIKSVRKFYQTGEVTKSDWDKIEKSDWD